jgi:hypothetical protein
MVHMQMALDTVDAGSGAVRTFSGEVCASRGGVAQHLSVCRYLMSQSPRPQQLLEYSRGIPRDSTHDEMHFNFIESLFTVPAAAEQGPREPSRDSCHRLESHRKLSSPLLEATFRNTALLFARAPGIQNERQNLSSKQNQYLSKQNQSSKQNQYLLKCGGLMSKQNQYLLKCGESRELQASVLPPMML